MKDGLLKELAERLATKINKLIDIPFMDEADEQAFFEFIILMVLEMIFGLIGLKVLNNPHPPEFVVRRGGENEREAA
jgi:hypothetical protein